MPVNTEMLNIEQHHVTEPIFTRMCCSRYLTERSGNHIQVQFVPDSVTDVASWLKQGQMQNAQLIEAIRLPTAQLSYFNGDPLNYWPFIWGSENCIASSNSQVAFL